MAIYYTQILSQKTKRILSGSFSLAGEPLKESKDVLMELKSAISQLPSTMKIFSLHSSKKHNLFYFKVGEKILIASVVDNRTTDKIITKYFSEVEKEFCSRVTDFEMPHYTFDDKLKTITDTFNKQYKMLLGVEELESTHSALVENLDTLIHRGENLKNLQGLAEKVNFETREMSRKVNQMKRNAKMDQYKIYVGVLIAVILLLFFYFRR